MATVFVAEQSILGVNYTNSQLHPGRKRETLLPLWEQFPDYLCFSNLSPFFSLRIVSVCVSIHPSVYQSINTSDESPDSASGGSSPKVPGPTQVPVPAQGHKRAPSDAECESVMSPSPEDPERRECPSGEMPFIYISDILLSSLFKWFLHGGMSCESTSVPYTLDMMEGKNSKVLS